MFHDLGANIYHSWSEERRREEISRLVEGYRAGVAVEILCSVSSSIAGSDKKAKKHLAALMTRAERKEALNKAAVDPEKKQLLKNFLG